jgi:hypothetical protein
MKYVLELVILILLGPASGASVDRWASSDSFSFARELASGSTTIVVPGNHTLTSEFDAYK